MTSPKKLWSSLIDRLRKLPDGSNAREYGLALMEWVKENRTNIGAEPVARFGLDWLSTLPLEEYLLESQDLSVPNEREILARQKPSSVEVVAMLVRDQIWELVTFKTQTECPNCGGDELRVLTEPGSGDRLVFACDSCGWAQDEYAKPWQGPPGCRPAKVSSLREHRLLSWTPAQVGPEEQEPNRTSDVDG